MLLGLLAHEQDVAGPQHQRVAGVPGPEHHLAVEHVCRVAPGSAANAMPQSPRARLRAGNAEVLAELARLIDAGRLEIPIANTYPLRDVRAAYRELGSGHPGQDRAQALTASHKTPACTP